MKTVYTVHAYRWGNRENHSYPVGVFFDKQEALNEADAEEDWRGGKYVCEVLEWDMTRKPTERHSMNYKIIKAIDN